VLHDAAVESATNLLAVVNDILHSPHISKCASNLAPIAGRPRSRTAPSITMHEAPSAPIAELPAMCTLDHQKHHKRHDPLPLPSQQPQHIPVTEYEKDFARPHLNEAPLINNGMGSALSSEKVSTSTKIKISHIVSDATLYSSPKSDTRQRLSLLDRSAARPSLSAIQKWPIQGKGKLNSPWQPTSYPGCLHPPTIHAEADVVATSHRESDLLVMRKSHESQVHSLREAHETEMASLRTYIKLLEQKKPVVTSNTQRKYHRSSTETGSKIHGIYSRLTPRCTHS